MASSNHGTHNTYHTQDKEVTSYLLHIPLGIPFLKFLLKVGIEKYKVLKLLEICHLHLVYQAFNLLAPYGFEFSLEFLVLQQHMNFQFAPSWISLNSSSWVL